MMPVIDIDSGGLGTVINATRTYTVLSEILRQTRACVISWTDGLGTRLEILFALRPTQRGDLMGSAESTRCLYVAVLRCGAFGFVIDADPRHPHYIGEKLNIGPGPTLDALADLVNGVMSCLAERGL